MISPLINYPETNNMNAITAYIVIVSFGQLFTEFHRHTNQFRSSGCVLKGFGGRYHQIENSYFPRFQHSD